MLYFLHITIMLHTFSSIKQTLDTHLLLIGAISSVNKKYMIKNYVIIYLKYQQSLTQKIRIIHHYDREIIIINILCFYSWSLFTMYVVCVNLSTHSHSKCLFGVNNMLYLYIVLAAYV